VGVTAGNAEGFPVVKWWFLAVSGQSVRLLLVSWVAILHLLHLLTRMAIADVMMLPPLFSIITDILNLSIDP